jgi:hypothetical protein
MMDLGSGFRILGFAARPAGYQRCGQYGKKKEPYQNADLRAQVFPVLAAHDIVDDAPHERAYSQRDQQN